MILKQWILCYIWLYKSFIVIMSIFMLLFLDINRQWIYCIVFHTEYLTIGYSRTELLKKIWLPAPDGLLLPFGQNRQFFVIALPWNRPLIDFFIFDAEERAVTEQIKKPLFSVCYGQNSIHDCTKQTYSKLLH